MLRAMIQVTEVSKRYGNKALFEGISWHVDRYPRVGLVGANGAGKSTLLAIISGTLEPDAGRVAMPAGTSIGYLPQEVGALEGKDALDCVKQGRIDLLRLESDIATLQQRIGGLVGEELEAVSMRLGEQQARYETLGGYQLEAEARTTLGGLGFDPATIDQPPETFSGGWRMRLLLARLLVQRPGLLLLDEPTNHLDLEALRWLEEFLQQYEGTVIIVSHDRAFLNRSVDAIAAVEHQRVRVYPGGYDAYVAARDLERDMLQKQAAQQAKNIAETERFIERFRAKNTKAKQVQSRVRALEKVERIELDSDSKTIKFRLPEGKRSGKVVVQLDQVRKAYGDNVVYASLNYTLYRGDRLALVGPNGAGKSTLMKILAGALPFDSGTRQLGEKVEVGYFAQHQVESLTLDNTVIEEMVQHSDGQTLTEIRSILGAFLFSGDSVEKRIRVLSGGEKNRLALARLLLGEPNFLLMDEPTNHLDLASREMLEDALAQFGGALVFISHDRYFINRLATKVVHVDSGTLREYPGSYDDYERAYRADMAAAGTSDDNLGNTGVSSVNSRKARRKALAELRARRQQETGALRKRVEKLETGVMDLETRLSALDRDLANPETYGDGAKVQKLSTERAQVSSELETLIEAWTEAQLELDDFDARYDAEESALTAEFD